MAYIKSFTEEELCKFILGTKESLFICLPLLHPEVINAIDELQYNLNGKVSINIGLDFTPETFRQGYGEIASYEDFWMTDYKICHMKDNRVSFVIADTVGYYLFFESRYFIPADKATLNAVKIDPVSIVRLKHQFFGAYEKSGLSDQIANAIIEESIQLKNIETEFQNPGKIISIEIDHDMIRAVELDLSINPPLKPDYKRIVEFYSNKFQYAQLVFNGANLKTKKIELPQKALPIKDADLKKRLEAKLNLFDNKNGSDCFVLLDEFKDKIQQVRDTYLTPLKSRQENILIKSSKPQFLAVIELLKKELILVSQNSLMLIGDQIENSKEKLQKNLIDFFFQNPEFIASFDNLFLQSDAAYKMREAQNLAKETIYHIKWPKPHELLNAFEIKYNFSDITFEDLQNETLLKELLSRKLIDDYDINNLADFGKAIKIDY